MSFEDLDALDKATAGGGKSIFTSDSVPGETHTGKILDVQVRQTTDFQTGQPQFWDSGEPKQQAIIQLQTDERDDPEDDGIRAAYVKLWGLQKKALMDAVRSAGCRKASEALKPGSVFTATFTGHGEAKSRGMSAPKLYEYRIVPGVEGVAALDAATTTQPYQAPTAPAYQPVATTPAPAPAPAPAAVPAAAVPASPADQVKALIGAGLSDAQIAQAVNLPEAAIGIMRSQLA
jgi:hypothetical protein